MSDTPALDFMLAKTAAKHGGLLLNAFGCSDCPFAQPLGQSHGFDDPGARADPDEGYFACALLGRGPGSPIFGENPACTAEDWQRRARDELQAHYHPAGREA